MTSMTAPTVHAELPVCDIGTALVRNGTAPIVASSDVNHLRVEVKLLLQRAVIDRAYRFA